MRKSLEVRVEPAVLVWARTSAGWSVEEIAKKLKTKPEMIQHWESGAVALSLHTLEKLAGYYKRPLSAFLLAKPPQDKPTLNDYRILPGKRDQFSRETRLAIRRAERLQGVAAELAADLEFSPNAKIGTATLDDLPEDIARTERTRLGINLDQQYNWRTFTNAFDAWRRAIESTNIIVFRFPMPIKDARGFSLAGQDPFAIVVSERDVIRARNFTLFHEYAHLILHQPGICIPKETPSTVNGSKDVERWCNRFAGEMLVPEEVFDSDADFHALILSQNLRAETLEKLSNRYKASTQVILLRMLTAQRITRQQYEDATAVLESRRKQQPEKQKAKGVRIPKATQCLQQKGRLFTSLVLQGRERNLIHHADVTDYLSLRVKHLDKLQSMLQA